MKIQEIYTKEVLPKLKEQFGIKNVMAMPRLSKVVINIGFGRNFKDKEFIKTIENNLILISGQKPVLNKSKKAISAFKIREGLVIGASVTLRGKRMWDFIEKLVNIYFPRVRDFRGINEKCIDNNGNITIGFKDILPFAEVEVEDLEKVHGLEISIATTAHNREVGLALFKLLNFPLKKD